MADSISVSVNRIGHRAKKWSERMSMIETYCKELKMPTLSQVYHELTTRAAKENWKPSELLEEALKLEMIGKAKVNERCARSQLRVNTPIWLIV
jgi:hypothetical protein